MEYSVIRGPNGAHPALIMAIIWLAISSLPVKSLISRGSVLTLAVRCLRRGFHRHWSVGWPKSVLAPVCTPSTTVTIATTATRTVKALNSHQFQWLVRTLVMAPTVTPKTGPAASNATRLRDRSASATPDERTDQLYSRLSVYDS